MMNAMIFAAGLGTRLKPLTDFIPKALVEVKGKPLIYHLIMKFKAAGVSKCVVNVHHFADKIVSFLEENDNFGMDIIISDERELLRDTGGGIRYAERFLSDGGPFLVHNVDILSNLDLNYFEKRTDSKALANILVSDRKTNRYLLFDANMRLVGWTNIATGELKTPFKGLDLGTCKALAFSGIHIISNDIFRVFDEIEQFPSDFPLYAADGSFAFKEPLGDKFSIVDFYLRACARYSISGIEQDGLKLLDVGKPDSLAMAENFLSL